MEILASLPNDAEILRAVERWIDDLAAGRYDDAFARTAHDPYYGWNPALMHLVVQGYGLPEPHRRGPFEVTDRASATGRQKYEIERDDTPEGVIAYMSYSLPLNGEWSDLTATFRVESKHEHSQLVLEEIHVF